VADDPATRDVSRERRDVVVVTNAQRRKAGVPPSLTGWDRRELQALCDGLPDHRVWDVEKHDRGEQAQEGESADYVDGFNDGLVHARALAASARRALAELEAIDRASEDHGVEHLELWRALVPLGGHLRRRTYNALVIAGRTTPASLRELDARALRSIHNIGVSSIAGLARAGLVDADVARDAIQRRYSR
jgi:hypothetical protein